MVKPVVQARGSASLLVASWVRGRANPVAFGLTPDLEASARGDRRRRPSVDRVDDLAAVDALEVDARDAQVGVPELPLDHDQRDALVRHLDRVRVP
jgi:hypothetical protein